MTTLASRIKKAREIAGLTQQELAKRAGLAKSTVCGLELGSRHSSTRTVELALACGVDPVWLATGIHAREIEQAVACGDLTPWLAAKR